jgi:NDP-sugar pyrophosphorylase family protein
LTSPLTLFIQIPKIEKSEFYNIIIIFANKGDIINMIDQAFILAGGEGTRLRPITEKIPKSMVEINGIPFLEHQLELLAENEVSKVVLCVGYLWEQIKDYFGSRFKSSSGKSIGLDYSVEPRFLGTGGAIKLAEKYADDYFFILYGDSYLPIDYQSMGGLILENQITGVISVYDNHDNIVNNNVVMTEEGFITKYNKHEETPEMNGVEAGALAFGKEVLDLIPDVTEIQDDQKISLEIEIYPKLIIQRQLLGYLTNKRFYDMGTPERINTISEVLK